MPHENIGKKKKERKSKLVDTIGKAYVITKKKERK
jgi:hypothetical protein